MPAPLEEIEVALIRAGMEVLGTSLTAGRGPLVRAVERGTAGLTTRRELIALIDLQARTTVMLLSLIERNEIGSAEVIIKQLTDPAAAMAKIAGPL